VLEQKMEREIYSQVKLNIKKMLCINLDHYKDEQMRRRLDSWLVRCGAPDWNEYFKRLRSDSHELSRFRDYLTINVSSFFRDLERWQSLQELVAAELLKAAVKRDPVNAGLRVWSAGCSIGAEPYSLAMLLDQLAPAGRHQLIATDLDRSALVKARGRGPYNAEEIQNLTPAQRAAYLEPGGPPFFIRERLARKVEFREHDLLASPFPANQDLIVCRNVVIYFTAETKDELYRRFQAALRPGGVLFVGATEIVPHSQEIGLRAHGISFYRRA
jgi:chemotaxis protein methyltransferase CheR